MKNTSDSVEDDRNSKKRKGHELEQSNCENTIQDDLNTPGEKFQDPTYPESISSYFGELSEGFRTDFKHLIVHSARVIDNSLKFFLPKSFSSAARNEVDSLQELELKDGSKSITQQFTLSMSSKSSETVTPLSNEDIRKRLEEENLRKRIQIDAALRMRCPSMWDKKDIIPSYSHALPSSVSISRLSEVSSETLTTITPTVNANQSTKVTEGKKISLSKLYGSQSISHFGCDNGKMLIIGNKRLMLVTKDTPNQSASVDWSAAIADIEQCSMSFQSKACIQLELGVAGGNPVQVTFSEVGPCAQIIQLIQERRNPTTVPTSTDEESSASTNANTSSAVKPLRQSQSQSQSQVQQCLTPSSKLKSPRPMSSIDKRYNSTLSCSGTSGTKRSLPSRDIDFTAENITSSSSSSSIMYNSPPPKSIGRTLRQLEERHTTTSFALEADSDTTIPTAMDDAMADTERVIRLSPNSAALTRAVARQIKHGVGFVGLKGKLESDGISVEKIEYILSCAQQAAAGATIVTVEAEETPNHTQGEDQQQYSRSAHKRRRNASSSPTDNDDDSSTKSQKFRASASASYSNAIESKRTCQNLQYSPLTTVPSLLVASAAGNAINADSNIINPALKANPITPLPNPNNEEVKSDVASSAATTTTSVSLLPYSNEESQSTASNPPVSADSAGAPPAHLKKYVLMLKNGVPEAAVSSKMNMDEVSPQDQSLVRSQHTAQSSLTQGSAAVTKTISAGSSVAASSSSNEGTSDLPSHLKKFSMMLKIGVPLPAVIVKMNLENISSSDQALITLTQTTTTINNPSTSTITSSSSSSGPQTSDSNATPADVSVPPHLKKFAMMLKTGVPSIAITAKMNLEKISPEDQELVNRSIDSSSNTSSTSSSSNSNNSKAPEAPPLPAPANASLTLPLHLKKFGIMLKSGVPLVAVNAKMNLEKVSAEDQAIVLRHHEGPAKAMSPIKVPPETPSTSSSSSALPAHLMKYSMMMKNGVPLPAVLAKMNLDKVSAEDQARVTKPANEPETETPATTKIDNSKLIPLSSEQKSKGGPKLLGLHWEPIDKATLDKSIWGSWTEESSALADEEFDQLVDLFSRKEASAKSKEPCNESASKDEGNAKAVKCNTPKYIDSSRVMNISIGLNSFKSRSMDVNMICIALNEVDTEKLTLDDTLRLREMLPTDGEVKALSVLNPSQRETLHETEIAILKFCEIKDFRIKLNALLFLLNFDATKHHIQITCSTIKNGADNSVSSEGLAEIMKSVLAIGNAMNDGTWKGGAMGFKLSSLTRLNQTKSVDGSSTVMDYLVKIMKSRLENGDTKCETAINIDESLKQFAVCRMMSLSEADKDLKNLKQEYSKFQKLSQTIDASSSKDRLNKQVDSLCDLLKEIDDTFGDAKASFEKMALYFGESSTSTSTELLFGILDDFLKDLTKAKAKYNKKQKQQQQGQGKTPKKK